MRARNNLILFGNLNFMQEKAFVIFLFGISIELFIEKIRLQTQLFQLLENCII